MIYGEIQDNQLYSMYLYLSDVDLNILRNFNFTNGSLKLLGKMPFSCININFYERANVGLEEKVVRVEELCALRS